MPHMSFVICRIGITRTNKLISTMMDLGRVSCRVRSWEGKWFGVQDTQILVLILMLVKSPLASLFSCIKREGCMKPNWRYHISQKVTYYEDYLGRLGKP